ncbi:hypothetical protein JR316_0000422 [Psilocybe cubensis]|uniref:Uncharacterized protein n=1 Tax=Psilocybe cubensis TaxID=181762 RepID=A0ACB8HEX5_PSICU|nr:hypothetical protein JR316_0000422 [Psilocybe cubensis]KAH9486358.1 hypothetical protein JR316_0000422 [Psilocybe cubensis]
MSLSTATDPSSNAIDDVVSPGQTRRVTPRSLVISPNLDALLEHEDRIRAQISNTAGGTEPGTPESALRVSPQHGELPGLPPPPRRVKGPKWPHLAAKGGRQTLEMEDKRGAETVSRVMGAASSSLSNPYINPAPTLEDVLMRVEEEEVRDGSESVTLLALPWTPNDGSNARQQSHPTRTYVAKLDSPSSLSPLRHPRSAVRLLTKPMSQDMPRAAIANFNAVPYPLGPSPDDPDGDGVVNTPWRRRPLLSHGPQSSISSMDSSNTSSIRPASTEENGPRFSISSTIYPGSSDQSHQHSLLNEPISYDMARNSFMDIYSPANPAFNFGQHSPSDSTQEPLSPISFAPSPVSENSFIPYPDDTKPKQSTKPPLPTTPKPIFNRQTMKSRQTSPRRSPPPLALHDQTTMDTQLPPTTNFLDVDERADLVRKSRKLARVFGQTPGADAMAQQDTGRDSSDPSSKPRRRKSNAVYLDGMRRHSMPLSPDDVSFLSIVSPTLEGYPAPPRAKSKNSSAIYSGKSNDLHQPISQIKSGSRTSFIDLSDDEKEVPVSASQPSEKLLPESPPHSLLETMSLDDQPDDERRRKRERLAKLHRFLGSRVPANLVLGIEDLEASLPAASMAPSAYRGSSSDNDENSRKAWLRRRRSNSSSTPQSTRPDELDRVKEDLDDKEKALNVRRAQKMEKVFGVAPPLTLYHTRHCPSPSSSTPPIPIGVLSDSALPATKTLNMSLTYIKPKTKKTHRPGTSESNRQLLPKGKDDHGFEDRGAHINIRHSLIYNHYQHSLNSLNDILDRDDRESLAELHDYLNNTDTPTPKADEDFSTRLDRRASIASTIKSERRRSLPARTSMISLAGSEYSVTTPKAEITTFQLRRRRAAKLTQFFGVNYRELINDVLESIESGVEHEQRRGTLRAEEVEDLRTRLRNLKSKRQGLF